MSHPLFERENRVKHATARGEVMLGLFFLSGSPMLVETCSTLPLDWVLVDAEASPVSSETILQLFQALTGSGVVPLVRAPQLDHHIIEHLLDLGAFGVLVPKVSSVAMAEKAVQAAFYPPLGRRGINPVRASGYFADVPGYLRSANERTMCLVQIETREGLANADAIAAVEGIDGLFLGPGDMASELGQPGDVTGPAMDAAAATVLGAATNHGKVAGIFAYSRELARQYIGDGFTFVAIANEIKLLRSAVVEELAALRRPDP
jgi:2-keto-3-deoxy-L-rhamnonate aldolase RhmA